MQSSKFLVSVGLYENCVFNIMIEICEYPRHAKFYKLNLELCFENRKLQLNLYTGCLVLLAPPLPQAKPKGLQSSPKAHFKAYFNTN